MEAGLIHGSMMITEVLVLRGGINIFWRFEHSLKACGRTFMRLRAIRGLNMPWVQDQASVSNGSASESLGDPAASVAFLAIS